MVKEFEIRGEKCGIFGATGKDFEAARIIYPGLFALGHRGQESSGIAVNGARGMKIHKGMGLVTSVYSEKDIQSLDGNAGIGHNRYSTSLGSFINHAQPDMRQEMRIGFGDKRLKFETLNLALAHNGNLPSTELLREFLLSKNISCKTLNDSEMMTEVIWYYLKHGASLEDSIRESYPLFTGAFSLVVVSQDTVAAVRDPCGIRPLSIGRLNGGIVFSSETCALDTVHAEYVGDVLPGQMAVATINGDLKIEQITAGQQKLDIFEFIYFARPDSLLLGKRVYNVRVELGKQLYREQHTSADVVIAIPDSGVPAAIGYSRESGIPYEEGFIKNRYIHRTFIQPDQHIRDKGVALKLNLLTEVVKGKKIIVIDDSIVRGTTSGPLVKMLREAGAREVHMKISSPPVLYPDFYGIDVPDQSKLIAAKFGLAQIREHIGVDSLQYLSYDGMIKAVGLPEELFNTSFFTGIYPIDIREKASSVNKVIFKR